MDNSLIFLYLGIGIVSLRAWWLIFEKAGFNGALSLLMFVPLVNIGMMFYLAFSDWSIKEKPKKRHRETERGKESNTNERFQCIHCGEMILQEAKYCRYCEMDLPQNWITFKKPLCPFCKTELFESDESCKECNQNLPPNWSKMEKIPCPYCAEEIPSFISNCIFCKKEIGRKKKESECFVCSEPSGIIFTGRTVDLPENICAQHKEIKYLTNNCFVCNKKFGPFSTSFEISIIENNCINQTNVHPDCFWELEKHPENYQQALKMDKIQKES